MTDAGAQSSSTSGLSPGHLPVMLAEVIDALVPSDGATYLDGTYGGGGYSRALLDGAACMVLAVDRDWAAIERGRTDEARYEGRLKLLHGKFSEASRLLGDEGVEEVDGIAIDLGVSSYQLDDGERGFSFMRDGPLDMRMDTFSGGITAAEVVNEFSEQQIADIIFKFGDEGRSRRIAREIVRARDHAPIERTSELAEIVSRALHGRGASKLHPATRTFQALRIYINDELGELESGLRAWTSLLRPGGKMAVVSFHSLEDRIVKVFMREVSGSAGQGSRHLPLVASSRPAPLLELIGRKVRKPSATESASNPRARSARLRVAMRTGISIADSPLAELWEEAS